MNWFRRILSNNTVSSNAQSQQPTNAYDMIGGDEVIQAISKDFYQYMATEPKVKPLRDIHPDDLAMSEQKLYEFLSGWLGGPQLFQQKYGHPALRARHMPFAVDEQMRDQWLECMKYSLTKNIERDDHLQAIFEAISQLADHMRNQHN